MTTTTLRHYHVASDYRTQIQPLRAYTPHIPPSERRKAVQQAARIWFNKRKLRQRTRQVMDFLSVPSRISLKYRTPNISNVRAGFTAMS